MKEIIVETTLKCTEVLRVEDSDVDIWLSQHLSGEEKFTRSGVLARAIKAEFGLSDCVVDAVEVNIVQLVRELLEENERLRKEQNNG